MMYVWVYYSSVLCSFFFSRKAAVFSTVSLSCISVGRFESSREHSQAWNSIIYWGRLPEDFLALFWDRKLSAFQAVPGHDSSFTVFFVKSSVAMVGYKRGYSKICVVWSTFKKYVTTVNGHQQTKWIISFLISAITSGCLFETHISEAIWITNSPQHFITSENETFLKLLAYCYSFYVCCTNTSCILLRQ